MFLGKPSQKPSEGPSKFLPFTGGETEVQTGQQVTQPGSGGADSQSPSPVCSGLPYPVSSEHPFPLQTLPCSELNTAKIQALGELVRWERHPWTLSQLSQKVPMRGNKDSALNNQGGPPGGGGI